MGNGNWDVHTYGSFCHKQNAIATQWFDKDECASACAGYDACAAATRSGAGCDLFTSKAGGVLSDCPSGFSPYDSEGNADYWGLYYAQDYQNSYKAPMAVCYVKVMPGFTTSSGLCRNKASGNWDVHTYFPTATNKMRSEPTGSTKIHVWPRVLNMMLA